MVIAGVIIGWFHIMAVVAVLGGGFFINVVLGKASKDLSPPEAGKLSNGIGKNFGPVAWVSIIIIIITGVVRAAALGVLDPSVLLETSYGNLLLGKIVLLTIIIISTAVLTATGLKIMKLTTSDSEAGGAPDMKIIKPLQKKIKTLSILNLTLGSVAVGFAVAMRFIGAP